MSAGLVVGAEVAAALAEGRAVVALESTIITHGLPRPVNLELAGEFEAALRDKGVVPATVGVVNGAATVGLSGPELARLAEGSDVTKASTRDLPVVVARRGHAGTTVAATATLARQAGVRVFATGGIGGVHRAIGAAVEAVGGPAGAVRSFDESADVPTLARTPMTVVCAGVKSILDVPATLERLETFGVTVLGYRTRRFPGFFVADSGYQVDTEVSDPGQVADVMRAGDELGLAGAILVANPVPAEHQLDPAVHDAVLADALAAAERDGVRGPTLTPYLLERLLQATGGASLAANIAAVRNNVEVAAAIALAWAAR